ncbi:hypothetical protein NPIL_199711 [Nephila pilipes]|uniref:Uncharacterized protein n=1 Tax=Nephila pilipes TaxID=299642 RepID=A0A8X6NSG2_NEPPI|nr:hypothetical protein NPIL_199711 [Nephila pilipes]
MNESSASNILQWGCEDATDYSIEKEPQRFDFAIRSGSRASWTRRGDDSARCLGILPFLPLSLLSMEECLECMSKTIGNG